MTFGEKVKTVRKQLFLSQQSMATKLVVSFSTVNRWEKERAAPNYKAQAEFAKLCKENDIKVEE